MAASAEAQAMVEAPVASTSSQQTSQPVTLTPLSGPHPAPLSYLLTVDSAKVLLDCGTFDSPLSAFTSSPTSQATLDYLRTLKELAPTLSLVVLTHPLLSSLGLLPWLRSRCGLRCPIYATLPTREMGRWAVEEWVEAKSAEERNAARDVVVDEAGAAGVGGKKRKGKGKEVVEVDVDADAAGDDWDQVWKVSKAEIRDAFEAVIAVRWTQPVHLAGSLKGYTLVAHRSGHTLGGSIYTLRPSLSSSLSPASSASSLLYAPLFNHVKEHHLDGAALLNGAKIDEAMRRIGVVVVGAGRSQVVSVKRADREKALLELITRTLKSNGSVLLPTDPSGRLLELLVILESHWTYDHNNLGRFPLCLISHTGKEVTGFVRSLTEWMGGQVGGTEGGERLLQFTHLKTFRTIAEMEAQIPSGTPKLVLTVPSTLSHGTSRSYFINFAKDPSNLVILTKRDEEGTLSRWLWGVWNERQGAGERWGEGKVGRDVQLGESIDVEIKRKIYLAGEELELHIQAEADAAELLQKQQAALDRSRRMAQAEDDDSDSSDEGDSDEEEEVPLDIDGETVVVRRRTGGFTGGAGAWDEFLDPSTTTAVPGGGAGRQSFDIYVKGAFSSKRSTINTIEGSGAGGALQRYRMFPVIERKRRVDVYGEAIDVEGWLKRGVEDDEFKNLGIVAPPAGIRGKRAREEEEEIKPDMPHRYTVEVVEAHLFCSLFVVDMEGLSDGRALKTILPQINPRKLVIVNGSPSAVADLATACRAVSSMTEDVFTPEVGQRITVAEETKNFSLRLGDSIMALLKLSRVEDYDVAYVSGVLHLDPESNIPVLERSTLTDATPLISRVHHHSEDITSLTTALVPSTSRAVTTPSNLLPPLTPSLFIGDLKLTVLKEKLKALNIPSDFTGKGVLICGPAPVSSFNFVASANTKMLMGPKELEEEGMEISGGRVAVRKVGRGKLVMEGVMGETYYVVRQVVYSLHAPAA